MAKKIAKGSGATADNFDSTQSNCFPVPRIYIDRARSMPFAPTDKRKILDSAQRAPDCCRRKSLRSSPRARLTLFDPAPEMLAVARLHLKGSGTRILP